MKLTQLTVADRDFYLADDAGDRVMQAASTARDSGEWLELHDARGGMLHVLIPTQALVVVRQYEVDDEQDAGEDPNDWVSFNFDD